MAISSRKRKAVLWLAVFAGAYLWCVWASAIDVPPRARLALTLNGGHQVVGFAVKSCKLITRAYRWASTPHIHRMDLRTGYVDSTALDLFDSPNSESDDSLFEQSLGGVEGKSFSPDGNWLVFQRELDHESKRAIQIWNVESQKLHSEIRLAHYVRAQFSHDSAKLAISYHANQDSTPIIHLFDLRNHETAVLELPTQCEGPWVDSLDFSHDGRFLSATICKTTYFWRLDSAERQLQKFHQGAFVAASNSFDLIAIAPSKEELQIWDRTTDRLLAKIEFTERVSLSHGMFSPEEKQVALFLHRSDSHSMEICVYDLPIRSLPADQKPTIPLSPRRTHNFSSACSARRLGPESPTRCFYDDRSVTDVWTEQSVQIPEPQFAYWTGSRVYRIMKKPNDISLLTEKIGERVPALAEYLPRHREETLVLDQTGDKTLATCPAIDNEEDFIAPDGSAFIQVNWDYDENLEIIATQIRIWDLPPRRNWPLAAGLALVPAAIGTCLLMLVASIGRRVVRRFQQPHIAKA